MKQELWETRRQRKTGEQAGGKKRKGSERGIANKREQETTERRGGRGTKGRGVLPTCDFTGRTTRDGNGVHLLINPKMQ